MSELVITAAGFVLQPLIDARNGPAEIRWWYSRAFLDSDNIQVNWGTGRTGFWVTTRCAIADGLIVVEEDTALWTSDNVQDPSPASISLSAALYDARGRFIQQLQIAQKAQWVVPSQLAPSTTWADFSAYNQAVYLANPSQNFLTANTTIAYIDRAFDEHPASDTELGTVLLTVPAYIPASPVVWGANDPLVRDADKIEGVPISDTPPLDGQVLSYNAANNQWEPSNQAAGTGNVISNETVSVDSEIALFSGTGGKTIKRGTFTGLLKALSGVVSAAAAAVDYVAPGLLTASGLTQTTGKLLGRSTASTGAIEEITVGTGLSLSGGTLSNTASDTGITQLTGAVTAGPGSGSQVAAIANNAVTTVTMLDANVTYAKIQDVSAASKLLGRGDSGSGDVQELALGTNLSMSGTTLNASAGTGTVGNVGTLTANQVIIGQGATDIAALGSLGTTVTVLHGNVGGAPSFAVVTPADAAGNTTGSGNFALATSAALVTPTITSPQTSLTAAHGSDDTYTGITVVGLNAGATIAQWEAVYLDISSTWQLADANGSNTYPARGLAVAAYVNTNPATILVYGTVRNDAWAWTPGGPIYLSGTAGALTQTAPSVSGDKVQQVGYALTADIAFFDFNSTYLTVT